MCKFNSHLFVYLVTAELCALTTATWPAVDRSLIDVLFNDNDYDLKYDQRQKGMENYRLKLDGFFIATPAEPTGLQQISDEFSSLLGEAVLLGRHGSEQKQQNDSKASPLQIASPDVSQKQENQDNEKKDASDQPRKEKHSTEGRGKSSSRPRVYIVNLLDYIRRNRHS